jgi:hypothetical protein
MSEDTPTLSSPRKPLKRLQLQFKMRLQLNNQRTKVHRIEGIKHFYAN